MGAKGKSLDDYLNIIPKKYRKDVTLLEDYKGNRTNISFIFSCGCKINELLKNFAKKSRFDVCIDCSKKNPTIYACNYCRKEFTVLKFFQNCQKKCEEKYNNLILGKDYVICKLCNFYSKSLGVHVTKVHKISHKEYRKNYGTLICTVASENYKESIKERENWLVKAKEEGKDLTEYYSKISKGVKQAIMSDPIERKRRSDLMTKLNNKQQSDPNFQKIVSETAKNTSARKDIQEQRAERLKNWRDKNPDKFYNKCVKKMITAFQSKPEKHLYKYASSLEGFDFKKNQFVHSELISNKSSKKQLDMGDKKKRIYIEFDGVLHFLPKHGIDRLKEAKQKDYEIDSHILKHNWTLIRVSYDQFIDKTKIVNKIKQDASYFKPECLDKIQEILKNNNPGIYKIGEAYQTNFVPLLDNLQELQCD